MRDPQELHELLILMSKEKVPVIAWNKFIIDVQNEAYNEGLLNKQSNLSNKMTDLDKIKLEETLRFQIERLIWKVEIDNLVKIGSFTVTMEKGAVKSVKAKLIQ